MSTGQLPYSRVKSTEPDFDDLWEMTHPTDIDEDYLKDEE